MKKHQSKTLRLVMAVMLVATLSITAFAAITVPAHTDEFYVNDFAGVLSSQTRQEIFETSRAYDQSDGTQIVVTTVKSLEGAAVEDYALEMARDWGIGGAEKNNGLLILVATEDREMRVEVGYGLEGVFNDAKAGRFMRQYATPYLKENKWDEGTLALYHALLGELKSPTPLDEEKSSEGSVPGAIAIMVGLVIIITLLNQRRGGGSGGSGGFYPRPRNYGHFGGGGFGGGGGFSGGGGGFSGGGGGFGGGGASGKF